MLVLLYVCPSVTIHVNMYIIIYLHGDIMIGHKSIKVVISIKMSFTKECLQNDKRFEGIKQVQQPSISTRVSKKSLNQMLIR